MTTVDTSKEHVEFLADLVWLKECCGDPGGPEPCRDCPNSVAAILRALGEERDNLRRQVSALKSLHTTEVTLLREEIKALRAIDRREYSARAALDSEQASNEILTNEVENNLVVSPYGFAELKA